MTFDGQITVHFTAEEEEILEKAHPIINEIYETLEEDEVLEIGNAVYNEEELESFAKFLEKLNRYQSYITKTTER